jgi:single-strand DNA-binding protein
MSRFITGAGNLAGTPELQHNDQGRAYTYARVIVADRYQDEQEQWQDGPATGYDVLVRGKEAENLVAIAQASGNVKVVFAGRLRETPWGNADKGGINRSVSADLFGYAGVGQTLAITRGGGQVAEDEQPF